MIKDKSGKEIPTVSEAAQYFSVSTKAIHDWERKKIIPEPPVVQIGTRVIKTYPSEFLKECKKCVDNHIKSKKRRKK